MASVLTAIAQTLRTARVTFDVAPGDLTAGANGVLNTANWTFDGQPTDTQPVAPVNVSAVAQVSTTVFDISADDDFSPGGSYQVTAKQASSGGITGVANSPLNRAVFVGIVPASPDGRDFALWDMIPQLNKDEDDSGDLRRFINCLTDLHILQLYRIDHWTDILDYDLAAENYLDLMLQDLGYPFQIALTVSDKRRLLSILVSLWKLKGTIPGIKAAIRIFVGYESDVIVKPRQAAGGWVLDYSTLGFDTILGGGTYYDPTLHGSDLAAFTTYYDFMIKVGKPAAAALTTDELAKINAIAEHMKSSHEHKISVSSVLPPPATITVTPGSGQNTVAWSAVAGAAGYAVFFAPIPVVTPNSPQGAVDPDNASPFVHTPLSAGQLRYYCVVARNGSGINGVASAIASGTAL